jgi:hypothetical protein
LTRGPPAAKIVGMFRRKRAKEEPQQSSAAPSAPTYSGGYVVTELPTYHGLKRKVVVYRSDPSGRIIKTFKKG